MSLDYDYPDDTSTREEIEQAEADRDPPGCICENADADLLNPDCYWHGTEGVETQPEANGADLTKEPTNGIS